MSPPIELDPRTADRLLDGRFGPEDAPPGYQAVARLVLTAGRLEPVEADDAVVTALSAAIRASTTPPSPRRSPVVSKIRSARAATVFGIALLAATGTAAATGNLPGASDTDDDRGDSQVVELPDNASDQARESTSKTHDDNGDDGDANEGKAEGHDNGEGPSAQNTPNGEHGAEVVAAVRAAQAARGAAQASGDGNGNNGIGATVSDVANGDNGDAAAANHGAARANANENANGGVGNTAHPRQNGDD